MGKQKPDTNVLNMADYEHLREKRAKKTLFDIWEEKKRRLKEIAKKERQLHNQRIIKRIKRDR